MTTLNPAIDAPRTSTAGRGARDNTPEATIKDERVNHLLVQGFYGLIGLVGLTVLLVSGDYLHKFAVAVHIYGWMAWTLPVALDAGGIGGALAGFISRGRARTLGWTVATANLAGSITANILGHLLDANQIEASTWMTILTGVVYPVEVAAMAHLGLALRAEMAAVRRNKELDELAAHQREQERIAQQQARAHENRHLAATLASQLALATTLRTRRPAPRRQTTPPKRSGAKPTAAQAQPARSNATFAVRIRDLTPAQYAELVNEARALRAARARDGLPTGRRVLSRARPEGLGLGEVLARRIAAEIDTPTRLHAITAAGDRP